MELFVSNIPYAADDAQLQRCLAAELHSAQYVPYHGTRPGQLNFKVALLPDRRGSHRHRGCGQLTLPSSRVGERFLQDFGGERPLRRITLHNRPLRFVLSKNPVRRNIVEELNLLPYADPEIKAREEQLQRRFQAERVNITSIQFGWITRDWEFSSEWERLCSMCPAYLLFDAETRSLRVKVEEAQVTRIIAFRFSNISFHSIGRDAEGCSTILFSLQSPPHFESEEPQNTLGQATTQNLFSFRPTNVYDIHPRHRHFAFDETHLLTSAYTSCALRLVCRGREDMNVFYALSREAGLAEPNQYDPPFVRHGCFSKMAVTTYLQWLQSLDWTVAFQLEAATRSLLLDVTELLALRPRITQVLKAWGRKRTALFLHNFSGQIREINNSTADEYGHVETIPNCLERCIKEFKPKTVAKHRTLANSDNFECFHVKVTPTTFYLEGPYPERTNRVIRSYPSHTECFVRVSFVDEDELQYRFDREVDGRDFLRRRLGPILHEGLDIAGAHLEFLAYSQSALRESSVWFLKPFFDKQGRYVNAEHIISQLGSFHDVPYDINMSRCPARYGARVSQAFTATDQSIEVEADEIEMMPDIERKGHIFTDGVGLISSDIANSICGELYHKRRRRRRPLANPTVFQIRLQGAKGMLSVDHSLTGRVILLRPSMIKFEAPQSRHVEIARSFDRPSRYFLNRPLVMLLEGLGVPYEVFKTYQDAAIRDVQAAANDMALAATMLEGHGLGTSFRLTSVMIGLQKIGVRDVGSPFYARMIDYAVHHVLREMKHRTRIPIPGGWTVPGVADVYGHLQAHEISVCVRCPDCRKDTFLEGPTLISRSPTIAPGDVQILSAVVPSATSPYSIQPLCNSIVFSTKGQRPIPSYLGGGDLDGDEYNVWCPRYDCECIKEWKCVPNSSLLPLRTYPPASYDPAPKYLLDRLCNMSDVADFFIEYISSDVVGIIAINWLIIADQSENSIFDPDCLKLAQLHSDAVDFPKSGTPVKLDKIPKLKMRPKPDWNAPETTKIDTVKYYESKRAVGKLFRAVDLPAIQHAQSNSRRQRRRMQQNEESTLEELMADLNVDVSDAPKWLQDVEEKVNNRVEKFISLRPASKKEVSDARDAFNNFASQLRGICADHALSQAKGAMLTEEEVVVGTIVAKTSQPRMRKDRMAHMREVTNETVRDLRGDIKGDEDDTQEEWLMRSWVTWKVAIAEHDTFGGMAFWWITLGSVLDACRAIEDRDAGVNFR